MTLRGKALLTIVITFVGLIVILYFVSQIILVRSFSALEEQRTRQDVERALNALSNDLLALQASASDWAIWDDTYNFIEDGNEAYIQANLASDTTFTVMRLNLVLYIHSSGRVVYGQAFDLYSKEKLPVTPYSLKYLTTNDFLLGHPDTESGSTGLILLPEGPMLIAAHPILTSEGEGPIRGTLVMGRYLSISEIKRLAELPGVEEKDIHLEVKDDILELTAEARDRKYSKEVLLPSEVEADTMESSYRNGILEIKLRKKK